ncbi:MAG TPA: hypothetical protein VFT31_07705 [Kribbella sp.]|nr:hypothetical protein [Kribbella sp.]
MVIVPSGFDHVVDVADRNDSTSTRDPCARADTAADTTSGRDTTLGTAAGFGSAAVATAAAGCATSTAAATTDNDTTSATSRDHPNTLGDDRGAQVTTTATQRVNEPKSSPTHRETVITKSEIEITANPAAQPLTNHRIHAVAKRTPSGMQHERL